MLTPDRRSFSLPERVPRAARQTVLLFGLDSITNVLDYGFHVFLGRALTPADFAVVQTFNSVVLIVVTTFGVMEPVLARYVAAARANRETATPGRAIFQRYFRDSLALGLLLAAAVWLGRELLATALHIPPLAVALGAGVLILALLQPLAAGVLQGQQRFVAYGLTRSVRALGRLATGALLVGLGGGVLGAITAFPIGALLGLLGALAVLGRAIWRHGPAVPHLVWWDGLRLAAGALVAYTAYVVLLTGDLIWVNHSFAPEAAGAYALAVLLRRILVLMPGAVVAIMYPRVVVDVTHGRLPDRLLWRTAIVVLGSTLLLTGFYFTFGPALVRLVFGPAYVQAGPLLGWMGVAMLGYSLGSIWLNLYLATRPAPFVLLLAVTAVVQNLVLAYLHRSLLQVTAVFALGGWTLALGGLAIYLLRLRPHLVSRSTGG